MGFCVLKPVNANSLFQFVYTDFKTCGFPKGRRSPFRPGASNGVGNAQLAHDFARKVKCVIPSVIRGRLKGVVPLYNKHFEMTAEQPDFGPSGTGNSWIRLHEIRLLGCRWWAGAQRRTITGGAEGI